MLDGNDKGTFFALRLLRDVVDKRHKPIIIWAGAGVSKWCGFLNWQETADHLHGQFRKFEPEYGGWPILPRGTRLRLSTIETRGVPDPFGV